MKIFEDKTVNWRQVAVLKLAIISLGIAIGATWPELFSPYVLWLALVGIALGVYSAYVWMR
jgi:hypothetical protein